MEFEQNISAGNKNYSVLRIPYFVLSISIVVSIVITYFYFSSAKINDVERFRNQTNGVKSEIENRLETYIALLRSGKSFFYANHNLDKQSFHLFVENLNLRQNYPGVLAMGYSKAFTEAEKKTTLQKLKDEGIADFMITPDYPRTEYLPIIYIEPLDERNQKVLGYDMATEITRKNAIDIARETGNHAVTGKLILLQETETDRQNGFIIYLPVYKSIPDFTKGRVNEVEGLIYSPFRAGDFIADVLSKGEIDEIAFRIYDEQIDENNFLTQGNGENAVSDDIFSVQNEIDVGGRKWVVVYSPTTKFYRHSLTWWTPIIFFLGLAISVILFYLSLSQSWTNQRLLKTADDLAKSGQLIESLFEKEKAARLEAEKAAQVKDEFLATVSHELRTPLNAIAGWVNIIKEVDVKNETKEKAISVINRNLRHQVNLIEQMIIFSDMDAFLNDSVREKLSVVKIINECLNEAIVQISGKGLIVDKVFPKTDPSIFGDRENIKKAFAILLDNSIKFTPAGGKISITVEARNKLVTVKIVDSGEGIIADLMPSIFAGFSQSDTSIRRKHGGLGLSLAITKKIIESHRGSLDIQSKGLDRGTKITVALPLLNS